MGVSVCLSVLLWFILSVVLCSVEILVFFLLFDCVSFCVVIFGLRLLISECW